MLALNQLREFPAIGKAIPLFEMLLAKKNLYINADASREQGPASTAAQDFGGPGMQLSNSEEQSFDSFLAEFLEYDALDRWDFGQVDMSRLG